MIPIILNIISVLLTLWVANICINFFLKNLFMEKLSIRYDLLYVLFKNNDDYDDYLSRCQEFRMKEFNKLSTLNKYEMINKIQNDIELIKKEIKVT